MSSFNFFFFCNKQFLAQSRGPLLHIIILHHFFNPIIVDFFIYLRISHKPFSFVFTLHYPLWHVFFMKTRVGFLIIQ